MIWRFIPYTMEKKKKGAAPYEAINALVYAANRSLPE
jgi:hypothetical protein